MAGQGYTGFRGAQRCLWSLRSRHDANGYPRNGDEFTATNWDANTLFVGVPGYIGKTLSATATIYWQNRASRTRRKTELI